MHHNFDRNAQPMGYGCRALSCDVIFDGCQDVCCQNQCESICEYCGETIPADSECDCLTENEPSGGGGGGGGGGAAGGSSGLGAGGIGAAALLGFGGGGSGIGALGGAAGGVFGGGAGVPAIGGGVNGLGGFIGTGGGAGLQSFGLGEGEGVFAPPTTASVPISEPLPVPFPVPGGGPSEEFGPMVGVQAVPEPASFLIYSLSSIGLALVRPRRRRNHGITWSSRVLS